VLVVDDDPDIRTLLNRYLTSDGFEVDEAPDGAAAMAAIARRQPDLILLDLRLATEDGFDVLDRVRKTSDVPVIMLTGRTAESDRVLGLRLGADDYVVKPFSPAELSARIATVLRRTRPKATRLDFGDLALDLRTREVWVRGQAVSTTAKEFDLLAFLASSPRQVFSREQLLSQVWGTYDDWQDPATVTEHIRRVRGHIEADQKHPRWIVTVRGVGYRFDP
jgi:DNA-binding response OmpR family regulator